jgi:dihydroxyacetone kinase-like predicted kinase
MAASQACDVIDEEIDARVIPTSTIPQGVVASMNFNPEVSVDENYNTMKSSLKTVKSAQITYSIKDTEIDGVAVTKDHYMALVNKKIIACVPDKFDALYTALEKMVDEDSALISIFAGEDITEEEMEEVYNKVESLYDFVDIDLRKGNQPVYSFIIGVE